MKGIVEYKEGVLYWKIKPCRNVTSVARIGSLDTHWELLKGTIPAGIQIDHINGIRTDNRIENLRLVTHQQNQCNRLNVKGYRPLKSGRYQVTITEKGNRKYLGTFESEEEATEAYLQAKSLRDSNKKPLGL